MLTVDEQDQLERVERERNGRHKPTGRRCRICHIIVDYPDCVNSNRGVSIGMPISIVPGVRMQRSMRGLNGTRVARYVKLK